MYLCTTILRIVPVASTVASFHLIMACLFVSCSAQIGPMLPHRQLGHLNTFSQEMFYMRPDMPALVYSGRPLERGRFMY